MHDSESMRATPPAIAPDEDSSKVHEIDELTSFAELVMDGSLSPVQIRLKQGKGMDLLGFDSSLIRELQCEV